MENRSRVVLYGDTLLLAGVRLSLEANPSFEVVSLQTASAAREGLPVEQELLALHPDVVIFDTRSLQPQFPYDLIQQRNRLLLIGVDPDRDHVLVWSGQHLRELSVQDLVEVIRGEAMTWRRGDAETGRG